MLRVGIVGWRGMVGSVLMERMTAENDFAHFEPVYFTTSQVGQAGPDGAKLLPADSIDELKKLDCILTCQGGDYTTAVYPKLRDAGWKGYWIDAASTLRMVDDSIIILDPVNRNVIDAGLKQGVKTYVGGNCTVSLMLMALSGLFRANLVEWISSMTYQAASGAGAKNMRELIEQMAFITDKTGDDLRNPASAILDLDRHVTATIRSEDFPVANFGAPLAASLIPLDRQAGGRRPDPRRMEGNGGDQQDPRLSASHPRGRHLRASRRDLGCDVTRRVLTIKLKKDVSTRRDRAIDCQRSSMGQGCSERQRRRRLHN